MGSVLKVHQNVSLEKSNLLDSIINICFFLSIVSIVFSNIKFSILKLFIYDSSLLSSSFLFIFSLLVFIRYLNLKKIWVFKYLLYYFFIFILLKLIIFVHGISVLGNLSQIDILSVGGTSGKLLNSLSKYIEIESNILFIVVFFIRFLHSSIINFLGIYFPVYCIALYFCYSIDAKKIFAYGFICLLGIICIYSVIELLWYLFGFEWSESFLIKFNPIFHPIEADSTWWPPLLWENQLRSIFSEPSYFAFFAAITLPIFIYIFNSVFPMFSKIGYLFIYLLVLFTLLTNSRTSVLLLFVVFFVLVISFFIRAISKKEKESFLFILFLLLILVVACISFFGLQSIKTNVSLKSQSDLNVSSSNEIEESLMKEIEENLTEAEDTYEISVVEEIKKYHTNTLSSFTSVNSRSNSSRLSVILADLRVWLKHPFLGVGEEFVGKEINEEIKNTRFMSYEVTTWINRQDEAFINSNIFPCLSNVSRSLAEGGIIGFILDYSLIIFLIIQIFIQLFKSQTFSKFLTLICFFSSLCANVIFSLAIASFFLNSIPIILLGFELYLVFDYVALNKGKSIAYEN